MVKLRARVYTGYGYTTTLNGQRSYLTSHAYWIKESLVEAGWTVYRSSDGLNVADSDLWTTADFQAIILQNYGKGTNTTDTIDGIWTCLRSPNLDANGDYVHICLSPRCTSWESGPNHPGTVNGATDTVHQHCTTSICKRHTSFLSSFVAIGLTLDSSLTAFTGGTPAVTGDNLTVLGSLPTHDDVVWSLQNLGSTGYVSASSTYLRSSAGKISVVTEGNQFWVINHHSSYMSYKNRKLWGLLEIEEGGYCVLTPEFPSDESHGDSNNDFMYGFCSGYEYKGSNSYYHVTVNSLYTRRRWDLHVGGFRSIWIKKTGGVTKSGPLADPMPAGWEGYCQGPHINQIAAWPNTVRLHAYNAESTDPWYLGRISDMIMVGYDGVVDLDRILDKTQNASWVALKEHFAYFIKWDIGDNPHVTNTVIPGG